MKTLDRTNEGAQFLGILMLDTQFPRMIGDAGNPKSFPFPTQIKIVEDAGSLDVVKNAQLSDILLQKFINAAQELEVSGAKAIISTCGFLIGVQHKIAKEVNIPVVLSSLSLYEEIKRNTPTKKIIIMTASKSSLGDEALKIAGIKREDVHIIDMENCSAFSSTILQKKELQSVHLDIEKIESFIAEQLLAFDNIVENYGAILLECGNLPPYAKTIHDNSNLPVHSILDAANQLMRIDN